MELQRKGGILNNGCWFVTESKLVLLAARQASKSGDEVLRQGIQLYLESPQIKKMAD